MQFESQWYIYLSLSANLSPAPSSLFADCLANAGPIVVNILYMYTIRQSWCGSHVFHHCFSREQFNLLSYTLVGDVRFLPQHL